MQYNDEQLVCQYGSQFNWLKYICSSQDETKTNLHAFINENGEISFDTSREIEIGEEFLYTFGKQHRESDGENVHDAENGMYNFDISLN